MGDKLTEMYDMWMRSFVGGTPTIYQAFQAGFTEGAVSMRGRAVIIAQNKKASNDAINSIGQLPDIPA